VPEGVESIVARCLAKEPTCRFERFEDVAAELGRCYREHTGRLPPPEPDAVPLSIDETQALAVSLAEVGLAPEAQALFESLIERQPNDAHHRFNLAKFHREAGHANLAVKYYREAVELDPSLPQAWFNLGLCVAQMGRTEEGLTALRRAAALGHPRANEALAALEKGGDQVIIIT
jgi:tetratricopeptide (TPR) repeat protein